MNRRLITFSGLVLGGILAIGGAVAVYGATYTMHRGWWTTDSVTVPLVVGVVAFAVGLAVVVAGIVDLVKS